MTGGKVPNSQSGFVSMECAVGLARDKSGTFAYKFQRTEAIKKKNLSAGPMTAIIFLPRSGDEFQGSFPLGTWAGRQGGNGKWKVLGGTQTLRSDRP